MVIATHFKTSNIYIKISTQITTQKTKTRTTAHFGQSRNNNYWFIYPAKGKPAIIVEKQIFLAKLQKTEEK